jgi:hypothetical protein
MTPEELFEKQNKITELEQDLYESITKSVHNYHQYFYFTYDIKKNPVQTDFTFEFFIPENEHRKIKALEFKTVGYKTANSSWADRLDFMNDSGEINDVYAFLMMNSKDFTVDKGLLEKPSDLKPMHLKKNTNAVLYEKYEARSLVEFLKDVHTRIIFPLLKKEAQEWPEILTDHKKIFNQLMGYLGNHKTNGLTPKQTNGLLELQSHYESIRFHDDLDKTLSSKEAKPKIKI